MTNVTNIAKAIVNKTVYVGKSGINLKQVSALKKLGFNIVFR